MAKKICVHGNFHLASLSKLVVPGTLNLYGAGFDWDLFCDVGGVENLCPWSLSFGFLYHSWLYLVHLHFMISKSIGIIVVALVVLNIFVVGGFHLAFFIKVCCIWYIYFS